MMTHVSSNNKVIYSVRVQNADVLNFLPLICLSRDTFPGESKPDTIQPSVKKQKKIYNKILIYAYN